MSDPVAIGIDSGASKTELVISREGREYLTTIPEGINYQRLGMDGTIQAFERVFQSLQSELPVGSAPNICVGLAGADDSEDQRLIGESIQVALLRSKIGKRVKPRVQVVQDSLIALQAAYGVAGGVVIVVGTGSIVIGRTIDGSICRTGGWGYLLGDEGSGHALGLMTLQRVAHQMDDGGELTPFLSAVMNALSCTSRSDLIHRVYRESGTIQSVAPVVIEWSESGDDLALELVGIAATGVAECFARMLRNCPGELPRRYVLTGGLSSSSSYRKQIEIAIDRVSHGWERVEPMFDRPVYGALSLARAMSSQ